MKRFALVSCGKLKLATPAPAKELYRSTLFKKARAFAEAHYDGWFILSARHGALRPDTLVAPYEEKLSPGRAEDWATQVVEALGRQLPPGSRIDFFGGGAYDGVARGLEKLGHPVHRPLEGLQVGERLRWYKQREHLAPDGCSEITN